MSGAGKRRAGVAELGETVTPPLRSQGLGRTYDGYIALGSFTVEIGAGELVALIGPNGAGKTTFLNLASGLLDPTSGKVEIAGHAPGSIEARRALSFLPDTPVFYEDLSVGGAPLLRRRAPRRGRTRRRGSTS